MQKIYWIIFIFVSLGAGCFIVWYGEKVVQEIPIVYEWQSPRINKTAEVLFVGDVMFDRAVRVIIKNEGIDTVFAGVKDIFMSVDKVVANLEGVFSSNKSIAGSRSPLRFTFNPELAIKLHDIGIGVLSQANNHALDFGFDGLAQSTSTITLSGMDWFGNPTNENSKVHQVSINTNKIAFVGYNEFSYKNTDKIIQTIKDIKSEDVFVVVVPHWGVEYEFLPSTLQKRLAHSFIDAGADVVVGGHPHVIEPIEVYKNRVIFYSVGNFVFDQWFQDDVMQSIAIKMSLSRRQVVYNIIPIFVDHAKPVVAGPVLREYILKKLASGSYVDDSDRESISSGVLSLKRQ